MMEYAFFPGCTIPVRKMDYELSTLRLARELGIDLTYIPEFGCCGFPLKSVDHETYLMMGARNLALAEERDLDICVCCSACGSLLGEVGLELRENPELRERINQKLKGISPAYQGKSQVWHFARLLYEKVGPETIAAKVTRPLSGIKLAPDYGCHYLKPSRIAGDFDSVENPHSLADLIVACGAEAVNYPELKHCCGGAILGVDEDSALAMAEAKLKSIKDAGAQGMVLICPFCSIMYETNQKKIEKKFEEELGIPVFFLTQIIGLALGIPAEELGLRKKKLEALGLMETKE